MGGPQVVTIFAVKNETGVVVPAGRDALVASAALGWIIKRDGADLTSRSLREADGSRHIGSCKGPIAIRPSLCVSGVQRAVIDECG